MKKRGLSVSIFNPIENYQSNEFLDCTIENLDYCDVYNELKLLIKHGQNPNDVFNAVFEYHALAKIGHVSDKVWELFTELTMYCMSVNLHRNKTVTLYRGVSHPNYAENGFSWTTDYHVAKWFATRFASEGMNPTIAKIEISTNACLGAAPYADNKEKEVIVHPEHLPDDIELINMEDEISMSFNSYMASIQAQ